MGHLKDGKWHNDDVATSDESGSFKREESSFRNFITDDGEFKPEKGRYHLYVSLACPWAHRTLIARKIKGLKDFVSVSVVHPDMLENSWTFSKEFEGATGDDLYGLSYMYEIYQKSEKNVNSKVTVPVLWDKKTKKIVNNESSEILRIFNSGFGSLAGGDLDLYPTDYEKQIDEVNELVYENVNNGVYKTGFAKTQKAYESSFNSLFEALDKLEERLEGERYLVGDRLTEADIRLITTLLRFDIVYFGHFKCNKKRISDYKNLSRYTQKMYSLKEIKETTNFDHIKRHYYYSHDFINPYRIIPLGPEKLV
jgi:putative glutathione S-transferase